MNAHSSIHPHAATSPAASITQRGSAKGRQDDAASFASQLDADRLPPAKAARQALEDRPDLAGRPFGAIVSLFARHEELPAADAPAPEPTQSTDDEPAGETDASGGPAGAADEQETAPTEAG